MRLQRWGMGLGLGLSRGTARDNTRDIVVVLGDSNARGSAADDASLVYVPDAGVRTWDSDAFVDYVPLTFTGLSYGLATEKVGPEMQFARDYRAATGRPLDIIKYGGPGSKQGFLSGGNIYESWSVSDGALFGNLKSEIDQAFVALGAEGKIPRIVAIIINLGVNDSADTSLSTEYEDEARWMLEAINANWPIEPAGTVIVLNRSTNGGTGILTVRAAQDALADEFYNTFLLDTDGFGNNGGADTIHYDLAGQIALGAGAFDLWQAAGPLDPPPPDPNLITGAWSNAAFAGITYHAGTKTLTFTNVAGSSGVTHDLPLTAGVSYQLTYTLAISGGSIRPGFRGGTSVNSTLRSTSGTYTDTIVAATGNLRLLFQAVVGPVNATITNMSLVPLP